MAMRQWQVVYAAYTSFFTRITISQLSVQIAKMHSDYLSIQNTTACLAVLYIILLIGMLNREQNAVYGHWFKALLYADDATRPNVVTAVESANTASILLT